MKTDFYEIKINSDKHYMIAKIYIPSIRKTDTKLIAIIIDQVEKNLGKVINENFMHININPKDFNIEFNLFKKTLKDYL